MLDSRQQAVPEIVGVEHAVWKDGVRLYLWEKYASQPHEKPALLFVHGSSLSGRATFDLQVPGQASASAMDWFASRGFDVWCLDMEGYGRSDKHRDINCDVANGADDCLAACRHIRALRGLESIHVYGSSSGALRAALFAQRHPELVERLALDAFVWTGAGSATLDQRRKKVDAFTASNRRPIDRSHIRSIFLRDHEGSTDNAVIEAVADEVLAHDNSVPNGTYVDMCMNLPLVNPQAIHVPTIVMRGQWDGIASEADLLGFFALLGNPDKQFVKMPGIAHTSFHQRARELAYRVLHSFLTLHQSDGAARFTSTQEARPT